MSLKDGEAKKIADARMERNRVEREKREAANKADRDSRGTAGRVVRSEKSSEPEVDAKTQRAKQAEAIGEVNKVIARASEVNGGSLETIRAALERNVLDIRDRLDEVAKGRDTKQARDAIASLSTRQQAFSAAIRQVQSKIATRDAERDKAILQLFPTRLEMKRAMADVVPKAISGIGESIPSGGSVMVCIGGRAVWMPASYVTGGQQHDHPFKVSCSASAVTITNGRHEWFRTTTNEYAETILGNATIGWDELIPPASNNDKLYLWVKREHDSGEVDTATIEVGGATTLETVPMPNYYTAVWIIAVVTNTNGALSVEQRVLEDLQNDGPDIRQSGRIMMWTSTTIPRGWKRYTGYDARFIAGYSGSGDYAAVGNTGGYTWHGQTENNHQDHNAQHQHDVAPDTDKQVEAGTGGYAWSTDVDLVTDGCITWLGGSSLPTYEGPSNDMFTHKGPFNSNADTDNRPPYVVALFIQKV